MATPGIYTWKSTQELEQKNQASATAAAMRSTPGTPFPAAPARRAAAPAPTPGAAPSPGVTPFAVPGMPRTAAAALRNPLQDNMAAAHANIAQGFQPSQPGPADSLARNELQKTLDANQRAVLEQSALSGRGRTGQISGDLVNYMSQSSIPAKMDLEGRLQANRMAEDTTRAQNAQGNLANLAGLEQQGSLSREQMALTERTSAADRESAERLGMADLSLREKQLVQAGNQFKDELGFKKYALDAGFTDAEADRAWKSKESALQRASAEKLGFADLSVREKQLAQNASQFTTEMAFKKYATDRGFTDAEAQRAWQSSENAAQRASTEKLGFAELTFKEQALGQEARQFQNEIDFKKYATDRGFTDAEAQRTWQAVQNEREIASREKVAFADLSQREKQLAQEGAQFKDELAFKKYAADRGFTDAEAQRAWQSTENAAQRASVEKVSFAQLSQQEKELAQQATQFKDRLEWDREAMRLGLDEKTAERVWQGAENQKEREARAGESALARELQKYLGDRQLDLDERQISETIRQFDNKLDFDKWATQAGLDEQAKDRIWKSNEADVQRQWESGERLGSEAAQVNLSRIEGEIQAANLQVEQILNLNTMERKAVLDKIAAATANDYQNTRLRMEMTHDQAMARLQADLTGELQKAGYDHETALQAAKIKADAFEKEQDRTLAAVEAQAEMLYKYQALQQQSGLAQQEIDIRRQATADQWALGLEQLGVDKQRVAAAIASDQFKERSGVIATMMELGGDNPAVIDRAAAAFVNLLGDPALPGGALLKPEEKAAMLAAISGKPAETKPSGPPINGERGMDAITDAHLGPLDKLSDGDILGAGVDSVRDTLAMPFRVIKGLPKLW